MFHLKLLRINLRSNIFLLSLSSLIPLPLSIILLHVNWPESTQFSGHSPPFPSPHRAMSSDFSQSPLSNDDSTSSITIALTVILLVFLFIGFFSVYLCKCLMESILHSRNLQRTPSGNLAGTSSSPTKTGLDPLLINSFPTFPYSSIKDFRKDKYGLECAICLVEFEDDSFLRLLTACCHVFHQECIDLWLESHKTCPVCRGNLDSSRNSTEKSQELDQTSNSIQYSHESDLDRSLEDAISIEIRENGDEKETEETNPSGSDQNKHSEKAEVGMKKFSRSHSTGHSMVKSKEEEEEEEKEDRYRLRLPEEIKIKIIRGHNWTGSCVTFEELSRHPQGHGGGFVEVSGS